MERVEAKDVPHSVCKGIHEHPTKHWSCRKQDRPAVYEVQIFKTIGRIEMELLKKLSFACALLMSMAIPAFASVIVNYPGPGAQVSSPFALSANATSCSSQNVTAMGFSLDSSTNTTPVN